MKNTNNIYIIGAGPTGAALSLFLSKSKIKHTVIDKAFFPRDKICGDGLTIEVMKVLKAIDPKLLEEFKTKEFVKPSNGFVYFNDKGKAYNFHISEKGHLCSYIYVSKREDFDNWLFEKAHTEYATILQGHELKNIVRNKCGVELKIKNDKGTVESHQTKLVIGCDGERSAVKKLLHPDGIKKNRDHYVGAVRQYYKGLEPVAEYNPLEFYSVSERKNAYFWIFHCPNGVSNVGIGAFSKDISELKINLKEDLKRMIDTHPALKERFKKAEALEKVKGAGIPLNSNRINYYGDNYLIIGDAASMAEPLTGKGIGVGMYAAMAAMPTITKALTEDDFSATNLLSYQRLIAKKLYPEWNRLLNFQRKFSNKSLLGILMAISSIPFVNKMVCRQIEKSYSTFIVNTTKF